MTKKECKPLVDVMSRRSFLKMGSAAMITVTLPSYLRKAGMPISFQAQVTAYPRQVIGKVSEMKPGEAVSFKYPWDDPAVTNFLIMLDEPAGGGVGPDDNIVAFNSLCPHQGGPLAGQFHGDKGVAGPCPLHWTTFDLTRHGMVISGHATQGLPQIILETDGDDIVATGVMGLIFGYYDNKVNPAG